MKKISDYLNEDTYNNEVADQFTFIDTLNRKIGIPNRGLSVLISNVISGGREFYFSMISDLMKEEPNRGLYLSESWINSFLQALRRYNSLYKVDENKYNSLMDRLNFERLYDIGHFSLSALEPQIEKEKINRIFIDLPFYEDAPKESKVKFVGDLRVLAEKHGLTVFTYVTYPLSKIKKKHYKETPHKMDWRVYHWFFPYFDQIFTLHSPGEYFKKLVENNIYFTAEKNVYSPNYQQLVLSNKLDEGKVEILENIPDHSGMKFEFDTNVTNLNTEALTPF